MEITRGKVPCAKRVLIYGTSGIGKSTLGACFPEAVFIDVEGSTKELTVGRLPDPERWEDIINELRWVTANTDELKTVVIDTIDWAERLAIAYVCKQHGLKSIVGANYGKGYVWLAEEISRFLRFCSDVVDAGINVVLIAHSQLRRVELPDEMGAFDMYDLKTEKRTAPLYKEWADMVLFCNYKTDVVTDGSTNKRKAKGGKRVMYTTHRPQWDAKNRLTALSVSDSKVMTANLPPQRRISIPPSSARTSSSISPLTSILRAWKTRVAGCFPPLRPRVRSTNSASSVVVSNGFFARSAAIALAMRLACGSSPHSQKISSSRSASSSFTSSAALLPRDLSMRMSRGPSRRKLKPRPASSS